MQKWSRPSPIPRRQKSRLLREPLLGLSGLLRGHGQGLPVHFLRPVSDQAGLHPGGEHNAYIITKFALPDVSQGGLVKLTAADILDQFSVESDVPFTQGGMLFKNRIYYTYGCPKADYLVALQVFDLEKRPWRWSAPTGAPPSTVRRSSAWGVYQGEILCNTCVGSLFAVPFKGLEEDLCTMK